MSGPLSVPLAIAAVFVPSDTVKVLLGLTALVCLWCAAYGVWRRERIARNASDAKVVTLQDRLTPKIGLLVNGNGIVEERDRSGSPLAKRVQIVVKSLADISVKDCRAEIERVERLTDDGSTIILNEPLRVEWGNVDQSDKFGKITIPAGTQRQVNLFVIERGSSERVTPVIPDPKQEFMESISKPGKYKVLVLVSSLSSIAVRRQFILDWQDYEKITLERYPTE
jgi:hypothetical protein